MFVSEREQIRAFGFNHSILADRLWGVCFCALQTGMALGPLFSFSFLDERKGGKRKSRRQGRRPNLPGTGCVYVMYQANFPSPGRGRQGRQPNLPGTGCVHVMYQANFPSPGRGRQGRRPNLPGTGCVYVMYRAHFPSPGRSRQGRRPNWAGTGRGRVCAPPLNGLMRSVIQVCGAAVGARGVGEGCYGACLGLK